MLKLNKPKPEHRSFRCPKLLDNMIVDIQQLLNCDYTEALVHILLDWEKFRYLMEKERLLKLHSLRLDIIQHELNIKKQ